MTQSSGVRARVIVVLATVLAVLAVGLGPVSAGSTISMRLTHSQGRLVAGAPVTFDGRATSAPRNDQIASWRYSFGDGTRAEKGRGRLHAVRHSFARAGIYTVTLRVTTEKGHRGAMSVQVRVRRGGTPGSGASTPTPTVPTPSPSPTPPTPVTSASGTVAAGGTLSTNTDATAADPIGTSVTVPGEGAVTISEAAPDGPPPSGFTFVGQAVQITAPAATAAAPLRLQFRLDASLLDGGVPNVFRNGSLVPACDDGAATVAAPDPCVQTPVILPGGDALFTVRTSAAGAWTFLVPVPGTSASASDTVEPGGSVSTNTDVTPTDPVGTSVTVPAGGTVSITEAPTGGTAPAGFTFVGQAVQITAPPATPTAPLRLEFRLDASLLAGGVPAVHRNGEPVGTCDGAGPAAFPDPCVEPTVISPDGDALLVVRTSVASLWTFLLPVTPGTVTGRVTDENGTGLVGVLVVGVLVDGDGLTFATTDANGDYTLDNLFPGENRVCAEVGSADAPGGVHSAVGYLNECIVGVDVVAEETVTGVDFALAPGAAVTGTVTDAETGALIPFASVELTQPDGTFIGNSTDAEGVYRIRSLNTGTYTACVRAFGYIKQCHPTEVVLTEGDLTTLNFELAPQVTTAEATVGAGESVATNSSVTPTDPVGTTVVTPNAGHVQITELEVSAQPAPQGFAYVGQRVVITAPDATLPTDPLRLEFVLDTSITDPAPAVFRDGAAVPACTVASVATPDPCVASVEQTAGGDALHVVNATTSTGDWRFAIEIPAGVVTGRILDENGNPLQNVEVALDGQDGGFASFSAGTDADGQFHVANVAPGTYASCVFTFGGIVGGDFDEIGYLRKCRPSNFTVADGQTLVLPDLVLEVGAAVQGTVTGSDAPAELNGVQVVAARSDGGGAGGLVDLEGNYLIKALVPGAYRICAVATGYQEECQILTLAKGTITTVNLTLDPV